MARAKTRVKAKTKPAATKRTPRAPKRAPKRETLPLVAFTALSPLPIAMYIDPHQPRPRSRGRRETGEGSWIEIVDYIDPVTGAVISSSEFGGPDSQSEPAYEILLDRNGRPYLRREIARNADGDQTIVYERDMTGKLLRVTKFVHYLDGTIKVFVTDYTTSPAVVYSYR